MLLIGLTGNIASGKSEVAGLMAAFGAVVIDADELAREAVLPGSPVFRKIVARWGAGVLLPDGSLDRAALRQVVFADPGELSALNAMVHPEVRRLRDAGIAEARAQGAAVVVADIPLLFEAGLERDVDRVVLVDAPEATRLERLLVHRGLAEDEARRMISAQMPSSQKRPRAHFVIGNDGSLDDLRRETQRVWEAVTR